jgi:hypothetical protein
MLGTVIAIVIGAMLTLVTQWLLVESATATGGVNWSRLQPRGHTNWSEIGTASTTKRWRAKATSSPPS